VTNWEAIPLLQDFLRIEPNCNSIFGVRRLFLEIPGGMQAEPFKIKMDASAFLR
jgi:hypothetical protein